MPLNVIFDLDDFCEDFNDLDILFKMKARWPDFKCTLFTIPMKCSPRFLQEIKQIPWIQMAVHGWEHIPVECQAWSREDARKFLRIAEKWGVFVKGFKAPMWRLSQGTVDALTDEGWWLADNSDPASNPNGVVCKDTLKRYFAGGNEMIPGRTYGNYHREHGHHNCLNCGNDVRQMYHIYLQRFPEDTKFFFIEDVLKQMYGGT